MPAHTTPIATRTRSGASPAAITRKGSGRASIVALILALLLPACNFTGIEEERTPRPVATATQDRSGSPPTFAPTVPARTPRPSTPSTPSTPGAPATPAPSTPGGSTSPSPFAFGAYFIEWGVYERDYVPADIPASLLTHLYYAFADPEDTDSDGFFECAVYDSDAALELPMKRLVPGTNVQDGFDKGALNQLGVLHARYPSLKMLISVGGAGFSDNFPRIASNRQQRERFAQSCVEFMRTVGFDGLDIDWEFPAPADMDDFTLLLQALRDALDAAALEDARPYALSIAAPANEYDLEGIDIEAIAPHLDWVNLMAYDFNGGWSDTTGHNAPLCAAEGDPYGVLWNASGGVQMWLDGGMPPGKIHLGLPYFGKAFQRLQSAGPEADLPGRFAPVTPEDYVSGTWDEIDQVEPSSIFDYWDIATQFAGPLEESSEPRPAQRGYTRYWDDEQGVPFLYHPDAVGDGGDGLWITYDDPQSLARKVQFARSLGLGGVFAWELSQEGPPGAGRHPLSEAVRSAIDAPLARTSCQPAR